MRLMVSTALFSRLLSPSSLPLRRRTSSPAAHPTRISPCTVDTSIINLFYTLYSTLMSENRTPTAPWPPPRTRLCNPSTPILSTPRTPLTPVTRQGGFIGSPNPLAPATTRKIHRNGYEQKPKTPSYRPFALNNPGQSRQRAFAISKDTSLPVLDALDPSEWNDLAREAGAIPVTATLHSFQVQISNLIIMRRGDAVAVTATGSGKSLTWTLPLLARKEGISLVVTPYTSLGLDGEIS